MQFQKLTPQDADSFPHSTLRKLFANLEEHIKDEEEEDLIKFEHANDSEQDSQRDSNSDAQPPTGASQADKLATAFKEIPND